MEAGLQKSKPRLIESKKLKITLCAVIGVLILSIVLMSAIALGYSKIYKGVTINGVNVGRLSSDEAKNLLNSQLQSKVDGKSLTITAEGHSVKLDYSALNVSYNIDQAIQAAEEVGRTGNIFSRLAQIAFGSAEDVKMDFKYDAQKIDEAMLSLYNSIQAPVKQNTVTVKDNKAIFTTGHKGKAIDKDKTKQQILDKLGQASGGELKVGLVYQEPDKFDIEKIYKDLNVPVKDATTTVKNNQVVIVPEVVGKSVDKSKIETVVSQLENTEDKSSEIELSLTQPKKTAQSLQGSILKDVLASFSTYFSTNSVVNANRGTNIRLASSKINGKILAPDEVFSFNGVVGQRTEANGYKTAHAYSGGQVIDEIGGGICQVSTTLYNSVLRSDLEVVERHNHSFTVAYVPLGMDATVSYGGPDFKFKNNTGMPLRIDSYVSGNNVYFKLVGTNPAPTKKVSLSQKIIKTISPKVQTKTSSSLYQGTQVVEEAGSPGYVVETYKTVTVDGKVTFSGKITTSTYNPHNRVVTNGTKKKAAAPPPTNKATQKPSTPTPTPTKTPVKPTNTNNAPTVPANTNNTQNNTANQ